MNAATIVSAAAALENDLSKIARTNSEFLASPRLRDPSSDRVIGTVAEAPLRTSIRPSLRRGEPLPAHGHRPNECET